MTTIQPINTTYQNNKKTSAVKKSAIIGAALKTGIDVAAFSYAKLNKISIREGLQNIGMSKKQFAIAAVVDILIAAGIGALAGKIADKIKQSKNNAQTQAEQKA